MRAYADPAAGRHSLQLEINKRLYMDMRTLRRHDGFGLLQGHLMELVDRHPGTFRGRTDVSPNLTAVAGRPV